MFAGFCFSIILFPKWNSLLLLFFISLSNSHMSSLFLHSFANVVMWSTLFSLLYVFTWCVSDLICAFASHFCRTALRNSHFHCKWSHTHSYFSFTAKSQFKWELFHYYYSKHLIVLLFAIAFFAKAHSWDDCKRFVFFTLFIANLQYPTAMKSLILSERWRTFVIFSLSYLFLLIWVDFYSFSHRWFVTTT